MRIGIIAGLCLALCGCSKSASSPEPAPKELFASFATSQVREVRLEQPSLAFVLRGAKPSNMEQVHYRDVFKLPKSGKHLRAYEGVGASGIDVSVSLFRREEDPEKPGHLLLKFEVVVNQEVLDVPEVSWNQEDDLDLIAGRNWLLKLTRHQMVAENQ